MIKAGFIGFGRMGITHFSILNSHPGVQSVGICDQSMAMRNILKKYVTVPIYSDHLKMLAEARPDFVVISTPTDSHSRIIRDALEKNVHIFVEKPFALSAADGQDTLTLLKGKNLVNQVGYVNRFNEVFEEVKGLLKEGVIGEVKNFSSEMYGATVLKDCKDTWRGKKESGGGCMYEFASHCIDLAVYLFGEPHRVTGSIVKSIYSSEVEDFVSSTFIYEDGLVGNIIVNWSDETYRKPTNIVTVFGTKGKIRADKHAYKVFLKEDHSDLGLRKGWNTRYITDFGKNVRFYIRGNEFTSQLDYFVECVEKKRMENIASFSDALKTDIIMEQIADDAAAIPLGSPSHYRGSEGGQHVTKRSQGGLFNRFKGFFGRAEKTYGAHS